MDFKLQHYEYYNHQLEATYIRGCYDTQYIFNVNKCLNNLIRELILTFFPKWVLTTLRRQIKEEKISLYVSLNILQFIVEIDNNSKLIELRPNHNWPSFT